MEKEKVLDIEYQDVFDKVAVRIKYQNFEVLKRGNFKDKEIEVDSDCVPDYINFNNKLFIQGKTKDGDNRIFLVNKEDLKRILEKVNEINEKYGIPKRWRAEDFKKYHYINSVSDICASTEEKQILDNERYELGNYFQTEEEAQKVVDSKEWQEFWEKVKAGEIGG